MALVQCGPSAVMPVIGCHARHRLSWVRPAPALGLRRPLRRCLTMPNQAAVVRRRMGIIATASGREPGGGIRGASGDTAGRYRGVSGGTASGGTASSGGCGGIGRRAWFRSKCPQGRGGSSPLTRIEVTDPSGQCPQPASADALPQQAPGKVESPQRSPSGRRNSGNRAKPALNPLILLI